MTDSGADLMQRIAEFGADNAIVSTHHTSLLEELRTYLLHNCQDQQAAFTLPLVVEQQKQRLSHLTQPQEYEYGTHERHKLDVYPAQSHDRHSERPPLLLFLPGGGFAVGDKRAAPGGQQALTYVVPALSDIPPSGRCSLSTRRIDIQSMLDWQTISLPMVFPVSAKHSR